MPGPFKLNDYDALEIHYQLHTSQSGADAPVATWHQGGPGGSSIDVGLYTEMGYFQISDQGAYANEYAWNKAAHMLYLESPAGSGQSSGYSSCLKGGKQVGAGRGSRRVGAGRGGKQVGAGRACPPQAEAAAVFVAVFVDVLATA